MEKNIGTDSRSNVFERVDTPLQEGMTFTSGEGETVALPNYVRALSAVWTDGVEIDGKTYGKTVQVTFQSELPENADLILMLGSVRDAGGNALCMEQPPCPAAAAVAPVTKEG